MIDGTLSEFIDQLYYGQEIVFLYNEKKYFIQGWWSEDKTTTTLVLEEVNENSHDGIYPGVPCRKDEYLCRSFPFSPNLGRESFFADRIRSHLVRLVKRSVTPNKEM